MSITIIHKQVPRADVPLAERVRLKEVRHQRYPDIEVIDPDETGSLSAASGDPTDEDLWGDPVNLLYPLAMAGQTRPDRKRANNARARFVQFANDQYSDRRSKKTVYERIVQAQLAAGTIAPSFDPEGNEFDLLLPADLRAELNRRLVKKVHMSDFDSALKAFNSVVTPEQPVIKTPMELLDEVLTELKALSKSVDVSKVLELVTLAKGLIHVPGVGEPETAQLSVDDHSRDENWAPVQPAGLADKFVNRSITNPLPGPDLSGALAENMTVPAGDSPRIGPMPGPQVPTANAPANPEIFIPQPHLPSNTPFDASGVSKGVKSKPATLSEYLAEMVEQ